MNEQEQRKVALIRSLAEGILLATDELLADQTPPATDAAGNCLHPADQRVQTPSMGHPNAFTCKACGVEVA
jgi:hypothetical protein